MLEPNGCCAWLHPLLHTQPCKTQPHAPLWVLEGGKQRLQQLLRKGRDLIRREPRLAARLLQRQEALHGSRSVGMHLSFVMHVRAHM